MIDPLKLALLCPSIYASEPAGFSRILNVAGIVAGIAEIEGHTVVTCRGSQIVRDWLRNFIAVPLWTDEVGFVHLGFWLGIPELFEAVMALTAAERARPLVLNGHSLGGAHVRLLAGKCIAEGVKVAQLQTYGAPRPAFDGLARLFEKVHLPRGSLWNRRDPVPLVPFPTLTQPWSHTEDCTRLNEAAPGDLLEPSRDHAMSLYIAGLQRLEASVALQAAA